ncbi:restriction endonuclease subunit S [Phyllobacterium zundukense]|uniref:Restriction endonuclease subunit S n=1 Tax=Phyllobacterium zundukense TaxID=1867719 RepID=A0ACD4CVH8_9HYPH|nr:restriction endonuclease subunit S [Phyllobacterium zundukense]UXN57468.1 restriction endonuclease subunit S [Phyllobacterium zundukense]
MLELREIADIYSGLAIHDDDAGSARFVRLSDLSDLKAGRAPDLVTGEPPAVARALPIEKGDLIVGARGSITDICLANNPVLGAFISLDLYLVRPNKSKVDPGYLAAFLDLPTTQVAFSSSKQGSGLARLPKEALDKLAVPLPPLPKQRLIAGLAQSFQDEATLLQRLANLNSILGREALARAIRGAATSPNS